MPKRKRAGDCKRSYRRRKHVARPTISIDRALKRQGQEAPEARLETHAEALSDAALHGVVILALVVEVPPCRRVGHLVRMLRPEPQLRHLSALCRTKREAHDC